MQKVRKIGTRNTHKEAPIVSRKGESALSDEGYVIVNWSDVPSRTHARIQARSRNVPSGLPIPGIGLTSDTSPKGSIIPQQTLWSSSRRKPRIACQQGPIQHASAIGDIPSGPAPALATSNPSSIRSLLPARKPVAAEVVSIPSGPIPFPMVRDSRRNAIALTPEAVAKLSPTAFTQLFPCKTKLDEEEEKLWWEIFGPVTDWD